MLFKSVAELMLFLLGASVIIGSAVCVIIDFWYDRKKTFVGSIVKTLGEVLKAYGEARKKNDQSDNV